jgi:hypothetical protein
MLPIDSRVLAISELGAAQPIALFGGKQSPDRHGHFASVAEVVLLAASVDSVELAHRDPYFGRFVEGQATSSAAI